MGKFAGSEIFSFQCLLKISLFSFAVFVIFTSFLSFGFTLPFLATISTLLLSIFSIVKFSKKKLITVENSAHDEEVEEEKLSPEMEAVAFCNASLQSEVSDMHEYQVEPADFPSASESSSDDFLASENFELNWASFNNVGNKEDFSSDDDEEEDEDDNLIEISFPDNTSSDELNEEPEGKQLHADLPEYFPESIFRQEGLMELLAEINEVNEEENLIEIDLSMGSIKGQDLEIKA